MSRVPPRLATRLLTRFSSGDHGEAIAGDLLEQYEARPDRLWYWRQVLSAVRADIVSTIAAHKWGTAAAVIGGWVLYFVSSFPANALIKVAREETYWRLALAGRYKPGWLFWTSVLEQSVIIYVACFAIGWLVARLNRRTAPASVFVLAASVLIFEYTMILMFAKLRPVPSGLSTVELVIAVALVVGRPVCIVLGGLFAPHSREARLDVA
jgi:hypothetical protein